MLGKQKIDPIRSFGRVLRRLRKSSGLSQEALALDAGVQRNYISLLELGRNQPTINVIFRLSKALEIKPAKLIQLVEDEISK
jgi:transcriptional regulator with XRE-family HTH domain